MKNKLMNNLGLKIMAVLCAVILWMVAVGINDPVEDRYIYNVPVQLYNTASITGQNKTYKVVGNTDSIRVTVRGPKKATDELTRDNIVARADCSKITEDNNVPIEVTINDGMDSEIESIKPSKEYVQLEVEDNYADQLRIEVVKKGTLPEGYVTGKVSLETNTMSVSGPESAVKPVVRAIVEVSMDGVTSDVNMEAQIKLLDKDGKEINNTNIKKSVDSVKVSVPILLTKEVPVSWQMTGTPEDGYSLTGQATCSTEKVLIAGRESALKDVEKIVIPAEEFDVTDATESVSVVVDIGKYLPSGVSLADPSFNGKVTLTAEIEAIRKRAVGIDESLIQVLNKPEGWLAEIVPGQNLKVNISGLSRYINGVDAAALTPHVDVASIAGEDGSFTPGEYGITVKFLIPDNVRQVENVTAVIRLVKIQEQE